MLAEKAVPTVPVKFEGVTTGAPGTGMVTVPETGILRGFAPEEARVMFPEMVPLEAEDEILTERLPVAEPEVCGKTTVDE
jgi:hypothetical protein